MPASDVLNNRQINEWMEHNANSRAFINDEDVGFVNESEQGTLEFDELKGDPSWRTENIESDAASSI